MDTHIIEADLDHPVVGLASPIGLPGESGSSAGSFSARERLGASSSPEPAVATGADRVVRVRLARPGALLAGVAAVMLFGAGGAGLYAFRDDIRSGNLDQRLTALTHSLAAMVSHPTNNQPSAPMEAGITAGPMVVAAPTKPVATGAAGHVTPPAPSGSAATLAREFASLQSFGKPGDVAPAAFEAGLTPMPLSPAPDRTSPPATATTPTEAKPTMVATSSSRVATAPHIPVPASQEAGITLPMAPLDPGKAMPAVVTAAPTPTPSPAAPVAQVPSAAPVAAAPMPAPVVAPREPAAVAAGLQTSSMTMAQQIEVVGLVKSLGAQLRETRIEVAQLHQVVAQLSDKVETRTTDFESRLGLAEASAIVQSSARAGTIPPSSEALGGAQTAAPPAQPVRLASARAVVPPPIASAPLPERRTVKDYVVKGASPGLAVLAALNPVSGSASVIEVGIGDPVPGIGKIKRVYQRGTTWIVETENGSIQQ